MTLKKRNKNEVLFWCIAFPGFGQFLNRAYVKGIILIFLELIINIKANLNQTIVFSFYGEIEKAIHRTDYQWLMFYPCVYMFSIWDAYRDAGGATTSLSFLPFVFSAYFGTIGVIYSQSFTIMKQLIGPVFLSILFLILGFAIGTVLKLLLEHFKRR